MVDNRRDLVVGRDLQKLRLELVSLPDIDEVRLVGQAALLQHDGDFPAIRRGPVVKINRRHGVLTGHFDDIKSDSAHVPVPIRAQRHTLW